MSVRRSDAMMSCVCVALTTLAATANAHADDNDLLLGAINDFCANSRGNISETAKLAMRSPFQPRDDGTAKKPVYLRSIYLAKLTTGAVLNLKAKSATDPVSECQFVGYSDDMAGLATRLLKTFDLPEPTIREVDQWRNTKRTSPAPRPMSVELDYGLQQANQKAGAFTLTISRQ